MIDGCQTLEQKEDATKKLTGIEIKGKKLFLEDRKGRKTNRRDNQKKTPAPLENSNETEPLDVNQFTAPLWKYGSFLTDIMYS
jgi:hypothetical protein